MNQTDLLAELEPLTYHARIKRMVELGQRARSDAVIQMLIADMERSSFYERLLALHACYGSRDGAHVARAMADPSRIIRDSAMPLAALVCNDAQLAAALDGLPLRQQRRLLTLLAERRRTVPIDAFLLRVDEHHLPQLIAYGSPELTAQLVEHAMPAAGPDDWRRLATRHPALAADALHREALAAEQLDRRLLASANAALPHLARSLPDAALALVEALLKHISLHQLNLATLAQRRPAAIADMILRTGDKAQIAMPRLARQLDVERLRALVVRGLLDDPASWLPHLAPTLRRVLYESFAIGWRDQNGIMSPAVVAVLPSEQRVAEARRHLRLPILATRAAQRLHYAAYLPWDEAQAVLEPFIRNPDPELRVVALPALIGAARYDRSRLSDVLQIITVRRNEQDPVRQAMLEALASLPASRWQAEHLPALGQSIRDALDAADCSPATAAHAQRLVIALLPFNPEWSAEWLATLGRERGWLGHHRLEDRLTDHDVKQIAPALLPVLQSWQPRERENAIFHVAALFGKRLRAFPELIAILQELTSDSRAWVASRALNLIAQYRRERLPALIPTLIQTDRSWITQPVVSTYLHRHRQDLLTPLLGQTAFGGRFSTGKTRFVLPFTTGFQRWTPAQQTIFAQVLEQVTQDEARDTPALFSAIAQLAALPSVAPTRLVQLADARMQRSAVRDVALRALGTLDGGEGIPLLLAALDDDRARIAIYALRSSLLQMPAERALGLLRAVPLRKVTVAKEVVRLLGELPGNVAYSDLLAISREELHRDVRVALLRALWDHLEQPETWAVLEAAAIAADPVIAAGVVRIPAERRPPATQQRIAALLATLLRHPDVKVRLDTLQRCATLPISDTQRALQAPLLALLDSPLPDERHAAANAVFATYVGHDAALVGDALRRIRANRAALATAIDALQNTLYWNRQRMLPTVHAVLAALADDPLTASLQLTIAITAQLWNETATLLRLFASKDLLHSDALQAAISRINEYSWQAHADELAAFETAMAIEHDPRLRRVALAALIALAQPPRGWNAEKVARLERYRADAAPLVAAAAQFTFPPDEELESDE